MYGLHCIERALRDRKLCPQCSAKARLSDIRILYVPNVKVQDNSAQTDMMRRLHRERRARLKAESDRQRMLLKIDLLESDIKRLKEQNQNLVAELRRVPRISKTSELTAESSGRSAQCEVRDRFEANRRRALERLRRKRERAAEKASLIRGPATDTVGVANPTQRPENRLRQRPFVPR
jgi:hypothetical protein